MLGAYFYSSLCTNLSLVGTLVREPRFVSGVSSGSCAGRLMVWSGITIGQRSAHRRKEGRCLWSTLFEED